MDSLDVELRAIGLILAAGPSETTWRSLCDRLDALEPSPTFDAVVATACAGVADWPARLRHVGSAADACGARWVAALLRGENDPRLGVAGWGSVSHEGSFDGDPIRYRKQGPIVIAWAQHLDPTFNPPVVLVSHEEEMTHAAGCGGGFASELWGDATRGVKLYDTLTEHAADDSSNGAWTVFGLCEGVAMELHRYERGGGSYTLTATGPAPRILQLAAAWAALTRDEAPWTLEKARAHLAASVASSLP